MRQLCQKNPNDILACFHISHFKRCICRTLWLIQNAQQDCQNRTDAAQRYDTKALLFCMLLRDIGHTNAQCHEKGDRDWTGCNPAAVKGYCHEGIHGKVGKHKYQCIKQHKQIFQIPVKQYSQQSHDQKEADIGSDCPD